MFSSRWLNLRNFCSLVTQTKGPKLARKLPNDPILAEIVQSDSVHNVLKISNNFSHKFEPQHIAMTCSKLVELVRDKKEPVDKVIFNSKFEQICNQALKKIRYFKTNEIISVLKTLSFLKISPHANIFKSFVILTQNTINQIDPIQLNFLHFILSKQEQTLPISTLMKSIPLVLENKLEFYRYDVPVNDLIYSLKISLENNLEESHIKKLVNCICSDSKSLMPVHLLNFLKQISSSKIQFKMVEMMQPVWFDILIERFHELNTLEMIWLFKILKQLNWFSIAFFEQLAFKALEEKWNLSLLIPLLNLFNQQDYIREDILELTSKAMQNEREYILNNKPFIFGPLLTSFSLVENNSLSPELVKIFEGFSDQITTLENTNLLKYLINLKNLLFVNSSQENHAMKAFYHIDEILKMEAGPMQFSMLSSLLMIHWFLKLEMGSSHYISEIDMKKIILQLKLTTTNIENLNTWLIMATKEKQFVRSRYWSEEGHCVHHLLLLNKDSGTFINVPTKDVVDKIPDNILKIAVIELQPKNFCKHSKQLKKDAIMNMKTLGKLGYYILPININLFNHLLDDQKVLYLQKKFNDMLIS